MPSPKPRIQLSPEQAAAYAKLREGIIAMASLDGSDLETLQAWLTNSFGGPIGEEEIVYLAKGVLKAVLDMGDWEDCDPDDRSAWELMLDEVV